MKLPETFRAAFVIARRDFAATVFSKTFLFFLLGPLFPLGLGFIFGGIGAQVQKTASPAAIAVVVPRADFALLQAARSRLLPLAGDRPLIELRQAEPERNASVQRQRAVSRLANTRAG